LTTSTPEQAGLFPAYPVRTQRLDLRPHREADLEDLLSFHSLPEVVRYVPWPVRDREQARAALRVKLGQDALRAPGEWLVLAVELRATGRVVGEVLLKWESDVSRQGELGFAMHPGAQGQGLAAEAARAVLRLGFEQLGLHRIAATCIAGNDRSVRLLTLRAGLLDELEIHVVPVLLGQGRRLFDGLPPDHALRARLRAATSDHGDLSLHERSDTPDPGHAGRHRG